MSVEDEDWKSTLYDRQQRRQQWTNRLLIVVVALFAVFAALLLAYVGDRPNTTCSGVQNLIPGQTVTITCPPNPKYGG